MTGLIADLWAAGLIGLGWVFWDWLLGIHSDLLDFAMSNLVGSIVLFMVVAMWRSRKRRQARKRQKIELDMLDRVDDAIRRACGE